MVTICEVIKRQNKEGVEFNALILQGGIELVKSRETGSWYATSKKASITSTFDDATAGQINLRILNEQLLARRLVLQYYSFALFLLCVFGLGMVSGNVSALLNNNTQAQLKMP